MTGPTWLWYAFVFWSIARKLAACGRLGSWDGPKEIDPLFVSLWWSSLFWTTSSLQVVACRISLSVVLEAFILVCRLAANMTGRCRGGARLLGCASKCCLYNVLYRVFLVLSDGGGVAQVLLTFKVGCDVQRFCVIGTDKALKCHDIGVL